ncbi:CPBP family intramembrane metalloprotease [Pediococcus stilesii]|uniref:CPBP family intramembrane metalloprotease n=1 Tax=Pediococcus stilesii TaxID=331679 RepID=A0A5R9BVT7_9LACO|nr:CPBP family intramembrane glutamic endopeptidase [Pediococcus stilesii]TLQ04393.1 CPBP family intramembrane metalloprotease [Pediococcus stilesii]
MLKSILKQTINISMMAILFVIIQIPTMAESFWDGESLRHVNIILHTVFLVGTTILVGYFDVRMFKKFDGNNFGQRITKKNVLMTLMLTVGSQVLQFIVTWGVSSRDDADILYVLHSPLMIIVIVTLVIISSVLEELLFQGALQNGVLKRWPSLVKLTITAIIFAFLHGNGLSIGTLALFFSGLAFALILEITHDIKMSIFAHATSNVIVLVIDLIF